MTGVPNYLIYHVQIHWDNIWYEIIFFKIKVHLRQKNPETLLFRNYDWFIKELFSLLF